MKSIREEIRLGESATLDFKFDMPRDRNDFLRTVIAFANCKGGRILFGIGDKRKIVGLTRDPFKFQDMIIDMILSECSPYVSASTEITQIEGKTVIVVEVHPGNARPYFISKLGSEEGTFIRIGATTRVADEGTYKNLLLEGSNRYYDEIQYVTSPIQDNDSRIVKLCDKLASCKNTKVYPSALVNINLLKEEGSEYIPTKGFMLLTDNPFYNARIQCARFKGKDKSVFIDRKEYSGPITQQIEDSINFVLNHINYGAKIVGLYRQDQYEIPPEAIRELITNAVVHRNYLQEGNHIMVTVFDDRISILSPGSLPGDLTLEKVLQGHSHCRNRAISRYFREIGLMENWGSGIARVIRSCKDYGLKSPTFIDDGTCFEAVIFRKVRNENNINSTDEKLMEAIDKCPSLTIKRAAKELNVSEATVNRSLKRLQEMGYLRRAGSKKTGEWVLNGLY